MPEPSQSGMEPRRLTMPLLAGILVLPIVFVWFLLRPGYSNTLRIGAFAYLATGIAIGIIAA